MSARKQIPFNLMVAGNIGLGKTSFINTLLNNHIINITKPKDNSINIYSINLPMKQPKKINIIVAPNLNYEFNDLELHINIEKYLKDQFNKYLEEESKIRRNIEFIDTRVNLMLYFLNQSGLTEADIMFLKRICDVVNIIPVIGKSDGLTLNETIELKDKVNKQAFEFQIRFYKFEKNSLIEESEFFENIKSVYAENTKSIEEFSLNDFVPFRVVNRSWLSKDEERYNGAIHINYDNFDVSDFQILKEILLSEFSDEFVDATHYELYESYRADLLYKIMNKRE